MSATIPKVILAGAVFVATILAASLTVAEEGAPQIDTPGPDLGFGQFELGDDARFGEPQRVRGRVDQRGELNPLAGRGISWPTGYIAPSGTLTYTNQVLAGQRLAFSLSDQIEISAYGFFPLGNQTYAGGGGQIELMDGDAWALSVGAQGRYRRTNFAPGTADASLGIHAVVDVIAGDNTSWNAGAAANIPVYLAVEDVDFSDCDTRRQWAEGECGTTTRRSGLMPRSGHWVSLFAGINHFLTDWLIVNVEAFSGVSQGNFWALESVLDSELNYVAEQQLVEETDWSAGLGPLGIFTLGLGATASLGRAAIQPSIYLTNYDGDAEVLPYLSLSVAIGGSH